MTTKYQLANPAAPYIALRRHFRLVMQLSWRDVIGRYRGSFMGLFWSFFNPLLMLAVYTFVFGVIFKSRWNSQVTSHFEFAVVLFAGLNINAFFAECANHAPTLIIENTNFVKRVVFPLETLGWSALGAALFHLGISTLVLLVFEWAASGSVPATAVLFPLVVLAFVPFVVGSVWLLSALGVFLRDLKQAIAIVTMVMMFLAPVFYPLSLIPVRFRIFIYLNPLTLIVRESRAVLVWGTQPDWLELGIYLVLGCLFAWVTFVWFEKARKGFADVL
ncbi:ABC transporter permease [Oleiagrimonas citrea]|jgi:lipopolysaccharide transport system permease protein|uniref:Transport permease protein n=1 Tax=Oleiagrimonas citrea TaxID=1665687 RepID=A0A846ZLF0_9GAMM|nr:ABC transporter permease [Oleiagrimonas citrea]NKZ38281.1 ABC transporter permease [Oleiagrimonas citrea]